MKREPQLFLWLTLFGISVSGVIIFYAWHFRSHTLSDSPADWGVLGDFFGGVLNPLISIFTMYFLIKTYLTQRKELKESEELNRKQLRMQVIQTKISASYELVKFYQNEFDRTNSSIEKNLNITSFEGKEIPFDKRKNYRDGIITKMGDEFKKIKKYRQELDE